MNSNESAEWERLVGGILGMWQPNRNDTYNWRVDYSMTLDGIKQTGYRKFCTRVAARDFIRRTKVMVSQDARITKATYRLTQIES